MRRQAPRLHALYKLQDGVRLHARREEEEPAEGVRLHQLGSVQASASAVRLQYQGTNNPASAKYIEGLENRLGRMESLLRLSGLLDEDDGATDLGALEKRLAEKAQQKRASQATSHPTSPSQATSGKDGAMSPQSALTSPEPVRDSDKRSSVAPDEPEEQEREVEALSEMMCSLVTSHNGETRYIGKAWRNHSRCVCLGLRLTVVHLRLFLWFLHLFSQGYPMGEREDWGHILPGDDLGRIT